MKKHAIIPIFIPHRGCPNDCVFCNQRKITAHQTPVLPEEPEAAPAPEACDAPEEEAPFFPQAPGMKGRKKRSSNKESPWRFWRW